MAVYCVTKLSVKELEPKSIKICLISYNSSLKQSVKCYHLEYNILYVFFFLHLPHRLAHAQHQTYHCRFKFLKIVDLTAVFCNFLNVSTLEYLFETV